MSICFGYIPDYHVFFGVYPDNYLTIRLFVLGTSLIQNPANVSNAAEEWSAALEATGGHQPQMRAVSKRSSTEM